MSPTAPPSHAGNPIEELVTAAPRGETRWLVASRFAEPLLGPAGLRFDDWQEAGRLETVKTGPHRTVYRARLEEGCFYLKHYRVADWKALLQNVVRPTRAVLEWNAAGRVLAAGVATFETVAVGSTARGGFTYDSYLVSRAIDGTEPLDTFVSDRLDAMPPRKRALIRQRLAVQLGRLVATLHRSRLIHRDLHVENILVRVEDDETVRLWLIDLHALAVCRRVTLRQTERNLSLLQPFFSRYATATDRARFFRAYWQALSVPPDSMSGPPAYVASNAQRSVARRIAGFCERDLARKLRKGDRKWIRGNRRLIIADTRNIRCRGLAMLGRSVVTAIRDDPESLLGGAQGLRWNSIELTCDGQTIDCRVEAFDRPRRSWWRELAGEFSEVRRAWEMGHALLRRGFQIPRPLAFVEVVTNETSTQYLITESTPNVTSLADHLQRAWCELSERRRERRTRELASRLARQVRRLHAGGFDHPALSAQTVLIEEGPSGEQIWFGSPQQMRRRRRLARRHIVENLASLNTSLLSPGLLRLTHRLRFLRCYLADHSTEEWKSTWRQIRRRSSVETEVQNRCRGDVTENAPTERLTLRQSA